MSGVTAAEFLEARLAEAEAGASGCMNCGLPVKAAAARTGWTHYDGSAVWGGWQGVRCAGKVTGALPWPDPARVLREVEAKRKILALHRPDLWNADDEPEAVHCVECTTDDDLYKPQMYPCQTVRALAAMWSDHHDYDPDWDA